jgi:ubiquinone/menaquinone biosynthesis C-methylase UbiE
MLGTAFSKKYIEMCKVDYVAPLELQDLIKSSNQSFDTGNEMRLGKIFEYEIWKKIESSGLKKHDFNGKEIFEMCGGTGFLTFHLLNQITPLSYTFNDISLHETEAAKKLINEMHHAYPVEWLIGDLHEINVEKKYDIIIGHSFIHHFYDVPSVLKKAFEMLKPGGTFISIGEPTYLSPIIEGRKFYVWPLAIIFPRFFISLIRNKNEMVSGVSDVWIFDYKKLHKIAKQIGFSYVSSTSFNFFRAIFTTLFTLQLTKEKKFFSKREEALIKFSIQLDSLFRKILPVNSFAHISLICKKDTN